MTEWDPARYERFKAERSRPFFDLLTRVPEGGPVRRVADLGCGTGGLTRTLLDRWPAAEIVGVDSSEAMLREAARFANPPRLRFERADLATWEPDAPLDRIVSNAALQWVPDHARLLERLKGWLARGGVLAVQVPNNRGEPACRELVALLGDPHWRHLPGVEALPAVEEPRWYAGRLADLGLEADLWETVYYHSMPGPEAIVEWLEGTTLRPVLTATSAEGRRRFLAELGARIVAAYAAGPHGTWFPFRRFFFIARRP